MPLGAVGLAGQAMLISNGSAAAARLWVSANGQTQTPALGTLYATSSALAVAGSGRAPATSLQPQLPCYATPGGAPLGAAALGGLASTTASFQPALSVSGQGQAPTAASCEASLGVGALTAATVAATASLAAMFASAFSGLARASANGSATIALGGTVGTIFGQLIPAPANADAALTLRFAALFGAADTPVNAAFSRGALTMPTVSLVGRKPVYQPAALLLM